MKIFRNFLNNNENSKTPCSQWENVVETMEQTHGELSGDLSEHIQRCPQCKEYYDFWWKLEECIQYQHNPTSRNIEITDWESRIAIQKIGYRIAQRKRQRKMLIWGLISVTALILLALAVFLYTVPSPQSGSVHAVEPGQTYPHDSKESAFSIPISPEPQVVDKDM